MSGEGEDSSSGSTGRVVSTAQTWLTPASHHSSSRAGRGKRTDANGSGNLGLKEVEFKLDIGKRRLPSPDVKRASAEKERAPEFVVKPRRQFVDEGQNAKFKVAFEGSASTQLSWSRNGKSLEASKKFKMYEEGGYHYLEVCSVNKDDSGMYVGTVHNSAGTDTASAELEVFEKPKLLTRASPAPTLSSSLQDMDVVLGERDVKLQCEVSGGERATVTWFHNGREVRQTRQRRTTFNGKTATLTLTEVGEDDGGEYQCVIKNVHGEVSTSCTVSTQEGEKMEPPVFIKELQDMEVEDGDKVELVVEVKGSQPVQVYWMQNNRQLTVDTPGFVLRAVDGVHSLMIPSASADSDGEFVCEAYNDYGDTDTFCRLRVKEVDKSQPPEFLTRPKPLAVPEGSPAAVFTCRVQGHPLPAVTWERNGCLLSTNERYKISRDGERHSLEIVKPQLRDSGQYTCLVQNSAGTVSHGCSLIVTEVTTTGNTAGSGSAAATVDFRAVLKSRQGGGQPRPQRSVDSDRSDKENVHDFRHVLRNNRQSSLPPSATTTSTTRFSNKTVSNGTSSSQGSSPAPSVSSVSSSTSGRSGGTRRNVELFEKQASPSPDRSALTSRRSASPDNRPSPDKSGRASRHSPSPDPHPSPVKRGSLQDRGPDPVQESVLTVSTVQSSQASPPQRLIDRSKRDLKACSVNSNFSKSVDRADWRKRELAVESSKGDFRSVLSKPQGASDHRRGSAQLPTDSKPSWSRPDLSRQQKNGHGKDVKQSDTGKVDFRGVLKSRPPVTGRASSVTRDSKPKVQSTQSETDFRSVLAKLKGEDRKPAQPNTAQTRVTPERTTVNRTLPSKDLNSLRSKFETPAQDLTIVQSKPPRPATTTATTTTTTMSSSVTSTGRFGTTNTATTTTITTVTSSNSVTSSRQSGFTTSDSTDSKWREGRREKEAERVLDDSTVSSWRERRQEKEAEKAMDNSTVSSWRERRQEKEAEKAMDNSTVSSWRERRQEKEAEKAMDNSTVSSWRERRQEKEAERVTDNSTVSNWRERRQEKEAERVTDNSTVSNWRERRQEKEAERAMDSTVNTGEEDRTLDVTPLGDTARFSDDLKGSDSSHLSDSAISSAFSDSSSAVSEVEVPDSRSRRRLERLKGRLGGGGSRESEDMVEGLEAPRIGQGLEDCSVTYGGQVVLQCKVSGVPAPDINWSVNHKTIKPSRFFQLSYQQNIAQLLVAEAFSEDEGEYTCTATNSAGTDSCSCYVTVEASSTRSSRSGSHVFEGPVSTPPSAETLTPATQTVRCGKPASFEVTFSGEPPPKVTWYRGKTALQTGDRVSIVTEDGVSTLTVPSATANDSGRYTVTLTNDLGVDQLSATLSVEDVPECPVGTPQVYDISRKSVSLSWCGPAYDGGSVITHYVIEVKDTDSKQWSTLVDDCKSTSYHALTLKADVSYQFRVRAANRLGLSEPSLPTPPVVMTDPLHTSEDYESDGCSDVFSPTLDYRDRDELPFEPREVTLAPGRKFEDHYEYLHEVGKGKFGSVYKCKDKQTGKIWAAKVLKVREKEKGAVRQEVEVMNHLAHPKLLMLWDAFEAPRTMVLVMEFVAAGELFERVIRDDFVLTERDCVHFVRQICSGVGYMHSKSILHLDLKPENVLCVAEHSNQIKIIDFGLARFFKPGDSLQVLFGTPEFIAPEVVNYDAISFSTDMWSIGVICYILLSGLSPFLGDNDAETLANVTSGEYDFDDDFDDISDKAKDFISHLLVKRKEKRQTIAECEKHPWLSEEDQRIRCKRLNTDRLRCFMARRKWQKTGNAIRALGRMASMQKLLAGGGSTTSRSSSSSVSSLSDAASGAPSASGVSTPVFSPPLHHPTSAHHPLSSAAVREVEEKRETSPLAANTTGGADTKKGENKRATETDSDSRKAAVATATTTATTTATATAAGGQSSPSSWRRSRNEGGGGRTSSPPPPAPSGRSKLTHHEVHNDPADVTDSTQTARRRDHALPQSCATTTTTTTNNNTKTDRFSPSRAPREPPADSNPGQPCAPRFLKEMVDCTAFKGDVVRFDVTVTGQPPPRLTWMLEEEEVEEDERHILELGENGQCSLIVRHVSEDDEGEYLCKALNSQGEASCVADLHVYNMGTV
ncbi:uncharacterized protein LOC143286078 isoform X2 [Babylonia areolata]|uniref:uncharacterized protein LOC143286078 isoform X2 n=1 Tax=Babylonia areolata TaxID=304850 RepID=UPI003FCF3B2C